MTKYCAWSVYILGALAVVLAACARQNPRGGTASFAATETGGGAGGGAGNGASTNPTVSEPVITARGRDFRVWSRAVNAGTRNGQAFYRTNSYVELATGLHYRENGQWVESRDEIEVVAGGAAALRGPLKVRFAGNINSSGAIEVTTRDDKTFRSHIIGIAYTDSASGQSALIAPVKDSTGFVIGTNQVIYRDAFTGLRADVLYIYSRGTFSQSVIFREAPASPSVYNMNPETTRIEIFTEFLNPPAALKQLAQRRDGLRDENLRFGATRIGRGRAFFVGVPGGIQRFPVPVAKTWEVRENRQFLIEAVTYRSVRETLRTLPESAGVNGENDLRRLKALAHLAPTAPEPGRPAEMSRHATAPWASEGGFVIDYEQMDSADVRLEGGKTYYVSGAVAVDSLTVEGTAVVKYAPSAYIDVLGAVECLTGPYRPAIFTAKDDNSIGEAISGSTGSPSGNYAYPAMYVGASSTIHHVRFSHAALGVVFLSDSAVRHSQERITFRRTVLIAKAR